MTEIVLDASALLALLLEERGADVVADRLEGALVSTANYAEVVSHYARLGADTEDIRSMLSPLPLNLVEVDALIAFQAGMIGGLPEAKDLSLGQRICLAFAKSRNCPVLTADPAEMDLAAVLQIKVELLR